MPRLLLNIDLGEHAEESEEFYSLCDIANIALGGHAGDAESIRCALTLCLREGVQATCHISFPDRQNFGRVPLTLAPEELLSSLEQQLDLGRRMADETGGRFVGIKPHGALYHRLNWDLSLAEEIMRRSREYFSGQGIPIWVGQRGELSAVARQAGFSFLVEEFADRGYDTEGRLLPRGESGAVLVRQEDVERNFERWVRDPAVNTLCIHADNPCGLEMARAVRALLSGNASVTT